MGDIAAAEQPLDLRAEVELIRRRSELLERRIASWEAGLLEVRQRLHALETGRDPESPSWLEALGDLKHRVDRLERRRRASATVAPPAPPSGSTGGEGLGPATAIGETVAIVRCQWSPPRAKVGDTVKLSATTDGVPAGTTLALAIHPLHGSAPIAQVAATCDGDGLAAEWVIPQGVGPSELFFVAEHRHVHARSTLLVID